ncbi:hypothetical protein ACRALDRAFT_1077694 [Sodiomyces alcalophilus JCM 7366]|uniref:uncharacterized protein n=1 Tax=Sodiomyces alcalophilus JCM 7366 TaxID=591952 RepID=UPI0039B6DCD0
MNRGRRQMHPMDRIVSPMGNQIQNLPSVNLFASGVLDMQDPLTDKLSASRTKQEEGGRDLHGGWQSPLL